MAPKKIIAGPGGSGYLEVAKRISSCFPFGVAVDGLSVPVPGGLGPPWIESAGLTLLILVFRLCKDFEAGRAARQGFLLNAIRQDYRDADSGDRRRRRLRRIILPRDGASGARDGALELRV